MNTKQMFRPFSIKPLQVAAVIAIFVIAQLLGDGLQPRRYWSDELGSPVYAELIPHAFGDWVEVNGSGAAVVNPVQAEMIEKIYSETVARMYWNKRLGRAVMLSVAYGKDQSTDTQLHTPEMCYPSQGFKLAEQTWHEMNAPGGPLMVKRVKASMGDRFEPLTYFVRNGDVVTTRGSLDRNLARLALAIRGFKVDGLLVRVSEVTRRDDTFDLQEQFLNDLFLAMPETNRYKLIGKLGHPKS